jgi:hypothetical protein
LQVFHGSGVRLCAGHVPAPDTLLNTAESCCLISLSDVSDPYLWNELVHYGGFDLLARPFEQAEVHRTLAFA